MAITWTLPTSGQSYTVAELATTNIYFTGEINDKSYNAYRFKLVASNSNVKFSNNTQTTYTSVLDNDDTFMTSITVTGVSEGSATITITLQGQSGTTWVDTATSRTVNFTVNPAPTPTIGAIKVYSNGWKTAIPYVYYNGAWVRAKAYIYYNGWKQLNT